MVGSATDPGLDGSALAEATNSIVAVIQYRLGAVSPLTADEIMNRVAHWSCSWVSLLPMAKRTLV
jgi:carboxylesterase type B